MSKKNVFGLSDNMTNALCYLVMYFSGIFFLIMEKENKLVRFHALQSTVWFGLLTVLSLVVKFVFGWIFFIGSVVSGILSLVIIVSWLYMMFVSYRGQLVKLPLVGDAVWENINK